ncbi:N-acetyllactosaminide beta-1,3-N-acetylglucosaminyltransferase 3 [Candoia aspera]|uniref:N-acetyllactosaminide beta-1,3-N-acetylglucosaminyltransferase 3 n=1 Tax=Candoia aspera TaxID=51853 RepID=UPI002FD7F5B8
MPRRWSYKMEAVILSLIGFTCVLFLLQSSKRSSVSRVREAPGPPTTLSPTAPDPLPECWAKASVANISGFAQLPDHIRDFLRYRHCKVFPLLLNVADKCGGPEASYEVFLLLAIKSSPGNYERREIIRKTWGQERTFAGIHIRRIFLTGVAASAREARKLDQLLRLENEEHGDILQWRFVDSFFNLTLKQVLFLSWMETHCPGVRFIFNGDDDVFANTDNIAQYLLGIPGAGDQHLFVGHLITNVGPIREKWSKYYVPEQVTPSKSYPPYCGGGGLLMSSYTSHAIYQKSLGIELFPIDDVYLGMCLQKAGLTPSSHMGIRTVGVRVPSSKLESFDPCYYKELLLVHRFVPYEMLVMWQAIHQPDLVCGKKVMIYQSL